MALQRYWRLGRRAAKYRPIDGMSWRGSAPHRRPPQGSLVQYPGGSNWPPAKMLPAQRNVFFTSVKTAHERRLVSSLVCYILAPALSSRLARSPSIQDDVSIPCRTSLRFSPSSFYPTSRPVCCFERSARRPRISHSNSWNQEEQKDAAEEGRSGGESAVGPARQQSEERNCRSAPRPVALVGKLRANLRDRSAWQTWASRRCSRQSQSVTLEIPP